MIVLSEEDRQQVKISTPSVPPLRIPDRIAAGSTSSVHLPDYETSQRAANQAFNTLPPPPSEPIKRTRRFRSRLWRLFFFALSAYVLVSLGLGIPFISVRLKDGLRFFPAPPLSARWPDRESDSHPPPTQIILGSKMGASHGTPYCNDWSLVEDRPAESLYHARTSATFPPQDAFELLSNTSASTHHALLGNLSVDINSDSKSSTALLEVDVLASSRELRSRTSICYCSGNGTHGLHIYIPDEFSAKEDLQVNVRLLFPRTTSDKEVQRLTTYLPAFTQYFGNLSPRVKFGKVSIVGAGSDINVESLAARDILVKNSMASISGGFNASEIITIDNIEGPIRTNVTLFRDGSRKGFPISATLDTGGGEIDAALTLQTMPRKSFIPRRLHSPGFDIKLKTFSAPIKASIFRHPETLLSPPRVTVQNNLAPARIIMDSQFTGAFDLKSKLSAAHIQEGNKLPEQFTYSHQTASRLHGCVGCEQESCLGMVEMSSSREPVELIFGEGEGKA